MAEEPSRGLADVVAAATALSDIDGRAGRLSYRGYDINDLAGRASFEEIAFLLQRGHAPSRGELDGYRAELVAGRGLGSLALQDLDGVARYEQPMEALRSLVSFGSADDPDAHSNDAARTGGELPDADPSLGIAANFLMQLLGARPKQRAAEIFDACLVLHADHTMNASTFAARVCAATLSDMHSAVVAAIATLKGPLHGGANEQVMLGLEEIRAASGLEPDRPVTDAVDRAVRERLGRGEKIMGFGHRVYKTEDPRATHLRQMSGELARASGDDTYYRMSRRMEACVFAEKGLYPNVDFYAATVYHYLGIPTDLFTPVFSVSRMAGWTAHIIEQHADNRLIRPDSAYIGERDRAWVPLGQR